MDQKKDLIIVTGSCGRIGSKVVKKLGEKYRIVGFELLKAFYASASEELVPVDLSSDESVHGAFAHIRQFYGTRIASVIHLAAYYSFDQQHSDLYDKITVQGTRRLLDALQDFEVEQFLFSSTMLVHKPCRLGDVISEDSPVEPKWDYPLSKVHTEQLISEKRGNIPSVIMRIAGVYDDRCHSIPISNQIMRLYEKQLESRLFPGNISHGASFLHMDDLVEAIALAVEKRKVLPPELTLLIGEPKTLSYDDLQRQISQLIYGTEITTFRIPKIVAMTGSWVQCHLPGLTPPFIKPWMIPLADDHYALDIRRAEKFLGWKPQRSLQKTLPIMVEVLKRDPAAWYQDQHLKIPHHFPRTS